MEPQEEKRRRRLLLVPGQCSEPEESYDERSKFSVDTPPHIRVVDDSDNEIEETEAVTPARPLQLLLSPMSSVTNALESMQFSEHQRLESHLATANLSPERDHFNSPTKKIGLESPDETIKSNLVSPDHEDNEIPTFDLSPYKTPTKRSESPELVLLGLRKLQNSLTRSRSLSCDRDLLGFKSFLEKAELKENRLPFKDVTNKLAVPTSDPLAIPKKRKLKKPTAESPPLRKSYSCLLNSEEAAQEPEEENAPTHHSSSLLRRTCSLGSVDGECLGDFGPRTCLLPTIRGSHPDLNCIDPKTVVDLIEGKFNCYDEIIIIDCRFDYEYKGGHVKTAKNMTKKEEIEEFFMKNPQSDKKLCIIFYCEFSSKRGPTGYRNLRDMDRKANEHSYPNLFYPEVYLMEGGYKNFYGSCKPHCDPVAYIEMKDPRFCNDMKENVKSLRQSSWKRSRSLTFNNPDSIRRFF